MWNLLPKKKMTEEKLFEAIKSEINYSETTKISANPEFASTEQGRLDLIDRYMMSKYRDGDRDSFGNLMVFYNIVSFPVEVASKQLDLDTKDIQLIAEDERYWETWLMEKELRFWMKDKMFGKQLNDYAYYYPRDGHVILKKVDDDIILVPLKNLRFRPDALSLSSTPIIEKYEYMPDEFREEAKKRGWENWRKVELNPDKVQNGQFEKIGNKVQVFGCWFPKGFLDNEDNYFIVSYDGHVLASWEEPEVFYKGLGWEKVNGRLLHRGLVEKLFNEQIYLNRIANYKADGLNWSSKHFWQTRDNSFNTNLLGHAENGEVFTTNDEITPVSVEERNLAFYNQEETRWESQAMRRAFAMESISGERSPSGTPLGSSVLQAQMTQGFYDQKKENLAMFLKEVLWDWVLPDFKKDLHGQHDIMMRNIMSSEKGAEKFFNLNLNERLNREKMVKFLPQEMWDLRKALISEELKGSKLTVPRGFYDDLKYKMEIVIVGESIDVASKLTTLQTLFQIIGSNPSVLQNKTTKNILFKMLNLAGFNPKDFEEEEVPTVQDVSQQAQAQRGGSIAAPIPASMPQLSPQQVTV